MENAPSETVLVWMRQPDLDPRNLMPALLKYDHSKAPENTTQVISNIYFILYIVKNLKQPKFQLVIIIEPGNKIFTICGSTTQQHRSSYSQFSSHIICDTTYTR